MKRKPTKLGRSRIEKYYQYVVIIFIALTVVIVGLIVYFSFSKTVIAVTPLKKDLATVFRVSIVPTDSEAEYTLDTIYGQIVSLDLEKSETFSYLTDQAEIPAKATGSVTIYNNYSKSQPLVEQTRLLSESGVLFRTTETVTVPAGGQATVNVEADEAGAAGNLAPTSFTIVALWPGLQDKIYAQSTEAMTGGLKTATTLTAENYFQAETELISNMETEAKAQLTTQYADNEYSLLIDALDYTITSSSSTAEIGDEVETYTLNYKLHFIAPLAEITNLHNYSLNKLEESLPTNETISDRDNLILAYEIENINPVDNSAVLKIKATGSTSVKISSPIFDRSKLTNKDKHEIKVYFAQFDDLVGNVEVKFSPFWVVRSPQLEDHIELELTAPID